MKKTAINKIMIMHPCIITRHGLYRLFKKKLPGVEIVYVDSVYDMAFSPKLYDIDLIVSELYGLNENINVGVRLLSFIQSVRKDKPLLIMSDVPGKQMLNYLDYIPVASFISLSEDLRQLIRHINQVLAGEVVISSALFTAQDADAVNVSTRPLSDAETRVYNLLQAGLNITQIAQKTSRSIKTVSAHKRNMMGKLGVNNEVEFYACFNQQ